MTNSPKAPWLSSYGSVREKLDYSTLSMAALVEENAKKYENNIAYDFMGKKTTYKQAISEIHKCAKALSAMGVKENDRVTVCLPNCPQAITMFYAINMVGAVANMIHPLSGEQEIVFYLNDSKSVAVITLDQFYYKFVAIKEDVSVSNIIVATISEALPPLKKVALTLANAKNKIKLPEDEKVHTYKDFLKKGTDTENYIVKRDATAPAVILYSGGTTGKTKGILLSNLNFNALSDQLIEMCQNFSQGDSMLAIMPMFHGFGLGVSIHTMLANGAKCYLIPRFTPVSYAKLIKKCKPNFIAGVPTLYETLLKINTLDNVDLSCLKGVFSGGDSLSPELKKRFDIFLKEHNCSVKIREGYGTTECVTASCLTPYNIEKEGSIGIPFPDTYYKIVESGTTKEAPYGSDGEICIAGPTVMMEYINNPEETSNTKQLHEDGLYWVHTGDLGYMDEDGFVFFKYRMKRMIITNGYNVYPNIIEDVLESHDSVHLSCVIGVSDPVKKQKVRAYIVLRNGYEPSDETRTAIIEHCKKHIAKYALPYDIEFREELPKTLVGKVAYRQLEEEAEAEIMNLQGE